MARLPILSADVIRAETESTRNRSVVPVTSHATAKSGAPSGLRSAGTKQSPSGAMCGPPVASFSSASGTTSTQLRARRPRHVEHRHRARPLQAHERIGRVAHAADDDALRLGPFVGAAVVDLAAAVGIDVEPLGQVLGDELFERVAAVVHQLAVRVPNRHRPAAEGEQPIDVAIAVRVAADAADFQPAERVVRLAATRRA